MPVYITPGQFSHFVLKHNKLGSIVWQMEAVISAFPWLFSVCIPRGFSEQSGWVWSHYWAMVGKNRNGDWDSSGGSREGELSMAVHVRGRRTVLGFWGMCCSIWLSVCRPRTQQQHVQPAHCKFLRPEVLSIQITKTSYYLGSYSSSSFRMKIAVKGKTF